MLLNEVRSLSYTGQIKENCPVRDCSDNFVFLLLFIVFTFNICVEIM